MAPFPLGVAGSHTREQHAIQQGVGAHTHTNTHTCVRFKNVPQGEWSALWNKTSLNQKHYVPLTNPLGHNIRVLLTCGKKTGIQFS